MTEKLYYRDSHMKSFTAKLLSCEKSGESWTAVLDRTAFFPEGGGQSPDTGFIGEARVRDVQEKNGVILHTVDRELETGTEYVCTLDWEQRYRRMQNHSGEHIVSGITHNLHGYDNVGFHMGESFMTIDFSGELSRDELMRIEQLANEAVRENLRITTFFPDADELSALEYRSKLELTENVRIVEITGIDRCACCAPHVERTGEIGVIKILDSMRHRGGVRISLVCGMDALDDYRRKQENVTAVSSALSAKKDEIGGAVQRILEEQTRQKERIGALSMELVRLKAAEFPESEGNLCVFDSILDEVAQRELVNLLSAKCRIAALFSGSDETGYGYILGSRRADLRAMAKSINSALGGRGGGTPEMIRGRASADGETIRKFIQNL